MFIFSSVLTFLSYSSSKKLACSETLFLLLLSDQISYLYRYQYVRSLSASAQDLTSLSSKQGSPSKNVRFVHWNELHSGKKVSKWFTVFPYVRNAYCSRADRTPAWDWCYIRILSIFMQKMSGLWQKSGVLFKMALYSRMAFYRRGYGSSITN